MQERDSPEKYNSNRKQIQHCHDAGNSIDTSQHLPLDIQQADSREPVLDKRSASPGNRNATGPRTAAGKRRSRRNALKTGIFSNAVIVEGEPAAEYQRILDSYREELQPVGMLEDSLVETLATIIWRKKRLLLAESAEVSNSCKFKTLDLLQRKVLIKWDQSRAGESSGGLLREFSNRFITREAIEMLTTVRGSLEKHGFRKDEDPWLLRKIYGLDHDGAAPFGIFRMYRLCSKLATRAFGQARVLLSHR